MQVCRRSGDPRADGDQVHEKGGKEQKIKTDIIQIQKTLQLIKDKDKINKK